MRTLCDIHKDLADGMDIVEVANLFVGDNQRRKHLFGKSSQLMRPSDTYLIWTIW